MFYIPVNIEAPLNGWHVRELVTTHGLQQTSKQTSKQDVLMDAGEGSTIDSTLPAHAFLDKKTDSSAGPCAF